MCLALAQAVLGGNAAAELHRLPRKIQKNFRSFGGLLVRRKNVDVQVRVADMAEYHVAPSKFRVQPAAIIRQHLAMMLEGHRAIRSHFQRTPAAEFVIHELRQTVAEDTESLAIRGGSCKPGLVGKRSGAFD